MIDPKEDQAAQRLAERKAARANRLLNDGLRRLREGKAPTKVQMPFVQAWLAKQDNEVKKLKKEASQARIGEEIAKEHWERIAIETNTIFEVLREFGIRLYGKGEDDHEWQGEVDEIKGGEAGYASFADALRAALAWRIALVEIR